MAGPMFPRITLVMETENAALRYISPPARRPCISVLASVRQGEPSVGQEPLILCTTSIRLGRLRHFFCNIDDSIMNLYFASASY